MPDKAVFLDRDDTLIKDPGYISDPDQVVLLDGVTEALAKLKQMGYKLIVVSNQSAVARGIVTEKTLAKIHERLEQLLAQGGVTLDKIYYCPYHPEGVIPKYRKESQWRKPKPGMILAAAEEMDIDLSSSWMIGNSPRDIEAGAAAGCKTILVEDPRHSVKIEPDGTKPDYRAVNMKEAVNIIRKEDKAAETKTHIESQQATATQQEEKQSTQPELAENQTQDPAIQLKEHNVTNQLLREILEQLRKNQRQEMFGEFSVMRLMAGVVQIVVLFCLIIAVWLLMSPVRRPMAVLICLGFAIVFQIMALTFFRIHNQK